MWTLSTLKKTKEKLRSPISRLGVQDQLNISTQLMHVGLLALGVAVETESCAPTFYITPAY